MVMSEFNDGLFPFWTSDIDGMVEGPIKRQVNRKHFKYFEACKTKVKILFYICNRIKMLDSEYLKFVKARVSKNNFQGFSKDTFYGREAYSFFPFFEAFEFENILYQGKACLDTFSKAIGSPYKNLPKNLDSLKKVLAPHRNEIKIRKVLGIIEDHEKHLRGLTLKIPGSPTKRSLRDLSTHFEKLDIKFVVRTDEKPYFIFEGAVLNMEHESIYRTCTTNFKIMNISDTIWYHTSRILTESFEILFS
jgi:hypothetical protein